MKQTSSILLALLLAGPCVGVSARAGGPASCSVVFKEAPPESAQLAASRQAESGSDDFQVRFVLSSEQIARLKRIGVVVSPGAEKEFFTVYEKARYDNVPIFVTSDSLLHSYHLVFDKVLRTAERRQFLPLLRGLNAAMLHRADLQFRSLRGSAWEEASRRAVAFLGVGSVLADPSVTVPAYVEELVAEQVERIGSAAGIGSSPVFPDLPFGEDYTQYIPRGHYTLGEDLQAYFKSMMWYGRMAFRLPAPGSGAGRGETRSALLLLQALREAKVAARPALDVWLDIYDPTTFLVGRSDDLTVLQYLEAVEAVYGPTPVLTEIADDDRLEAFVERISLLPPPRILGLVIGENQEEGAVSKGFRFMGQRFLADSYVLRELVYRNVGTAERRRGLPMGLDVMAALGSERAYAILDELGETRYANYREQMVKLRSWTSGLSSEEWAETLYNGWLHTLRALLDPPGEDCPRFMSSAAWLDKQLSSSLGSWAELRHDTILYAKQSYAEMGGNPWDPPLPKAAQGYVEPVPVFYARLSALATETQDRLEQRGLLREREARALTRLTRLTDSLRAISEKELRGEPLTEREVSLIRFHGGELEHYVMASADLPDEERFGTAYMDEDPQAAVIADVATDPDPNRDGIPDPVVLQEGVGRIDEIYVVVPAVAEDGTVSLEVAKGGVFSYYEFPWPADDRLTDEKWRGMLERGEQPERPCWIHSFFTEETEHAAVRRTIDILRGQVVWAFWTARANESWPPAVAEVFGPELRALAEAGQYVARRSIAVDYRSVDFQSPDLAVVAVRETWEEARHRLTGEEPQQEDPALARRGPFARDVTYTLERGPGGWRVSRAVFDGAAPDWGPLE